MITGELRNKIDKIWETFWTGGITNPLDVIEQFTYLLFIKQLDEVEITDRWCGLIAMKSDAENCKINLLKDF